MSLMGFKSSRRLKASEIEAGRVYRSHPANGVVETARVLSVMPDRLGIQHVHFRVKVQQKAYDWFEDSRTLNMTSFMERFPLRHEMGTA
ncbi:hypothetical protein [Fodinicurvata fenggangensis]|uniref:hypothetical protein n=1 Tax=Fodinicurvata fenggangensis TaxID=1121830 RepID=UPI00047EBDE2|nr:hypothetical protein [Fodinicurvata fenggangensis]